MLRFQEIMNVTNDMRIPVRGYLSCVIGCPYEGIISSKVVGQLTEQLLRLGCYEIALSDTIGIGTPKSTTLMLDDALIATGGQTNVLAVHYHDT
jgi:hydroxymethylglutaryl-CoA lyase